MKKLVNFTIKNLKIISNDTALELPAELENKVDKMWSKYEEESKKTGRKIWNGTVYRLFDIQEENKQIVLKLSTIQYKQYLAAPHLREAMNMLPFNKRINGLYVGAQVITADNKYIIGKTMSNTIFLHKYDLISGSLNKDETVISNANDLVNYMKSELLEETGITEDFIKEVEGICILITTSTRIGIFFSIRLNLPSEKLVKHLKVNFEYKELLILSESEFANLINNDESGVNPTAKFIFEELRSRENPIS